MKYTKQGSQDIKNKISVQLADGSSSNTSNNVTRTKQDKSLINTTIGGGNSHVHHYETRSRTARIRSSGTVKITRHDLKQLTITAANGSHDCLRTVNRSLSSSSSPVLSPLTPRQTSSISGGGATRGRRCGLTYHLAPKKKIEKLKLHVLYLINK